MPTLVQINTVVNYTSTGRIAEGIGKAAMAQGWRSVIAFGRHARTSASERIDLSDRWGTATHVLLTRVADRHGLHSRRATARLIRRLDELRPDVIHLHNLHGYYLDYRGLFGWLREAGVPVVWTLHDCWAFTGHCCYFDALEHFDGPGCTRWISGCMRCPLKHTYPASFGLDRSSTNWAEKRSVFRDLPRLHLVTPCRWLGDQVRRSFLSRHPCATIPYGIDLDAFRPIPDEPAPRLLGLDAKHLVLAVASKWDSRKGLDHITALRSRLPRGSFAIAVVGVNREQARRLPEGVIPIERTESLEELAVLYSRASVFVNPTLADNFPLTNLESLACGTPVVTYDTGGSPEAIDSSTGAVVPKGDVDAAASAIERLAGWDREAVRVRCRHRAASLYSLEAQYRGYVNLYRGLLAEGYGDV